MKKVLDLVPFVRNPLKLKTSVITFVRSVWLQR